MSKAFTLIELLVVISIIALILAILLPSFMQTRESAQRFVCASQSHQQGLATASFASDHDNNYPNHVKRGHWAFGGLIQSGPSNKPEQQVPAGATHLHSLGYLNDPRIYYCPSTHKRAGITYDRHWRPSNYYSTFVAYQYYAGYEAPSNARIDHSKLAGPSIEETRGDILSMDLMVNVGGGWWLSNHIGDAGVPIGFNRLLVDQSVEWVWLNDTVETWHHQNREFYY